MGFLSKKQDIGKAQEELEFYKVKSESLKYQSEAAEREAVIKQLKREYGPGWKKLLGLGGGEDSQTLKSFLSSFKVKAKKLHTGDTEKLSPLPNMKPGVPAVKMPIQDKSKSKHSVLFPNR